MSANAVFEHQLIKAAQTIEDHLDAELDRLDKFNDDDLEVLRQKRLQEIKKNNEEKQGWITAGHGEYTELGEEREFFNVSKVSQRVVCHFYTESSTNCKIIDKHLKLLAPKHMETKFCKINAEKTPFLVEKLKVTMMPTLVLIGDGVILGSVRGFDSLGGRDDFSTEMLEWRLGTAKIIKYSGDLTIPPDTKQKSNKSITGITGKNKNKSIRGKANDDSDDDDEDGNDW